MERYACAGQVLLVLLEPDRTKGGVKPVKTLIDRFLLQPIVLCLAVVCFTATVAQAVGIGKVTVTADQANVMQGKNVLFTAKKGDTFEISEQKGDWYGLLPSRGWIHKANVRYEPAEPLGAVAVVKTGPQEIIPALSFGLVVGFTKCDVFSDPQLERRDSMLQAGIRVEVLRELSNAAEVRTPSGGTGWLRKCYLCSAKEFGRRKAADEVPQNLICVGFDAGGSFLYGGSLSIANNQFVVQPGDAFWMDPTMKGKTFEIAGQKINGNPEVLVLYNAHKKLVLLPIARMPSGDSPPANVQDKGQPSASAPGAAEKPLGPTAPPSRERVREVLASLGAFTEFEVLSDDGASGEDTAKVMDCASHLAESGPGALREAVARLAKGTRKIPYITMTVSQSVQLTRLQEILGKEDAAQREGDFKEPGPVWACKSRLTQKVRQSSGSSAVIWYKYGWLSFGVAKGKVALVRTSCRDVPEK